MRVEFVRSGGFAGLRMVASVDTQTLPQDQAHEVELLVVNSGFFDLPEQIQTQASGADRFQFRVLVTDGNRSHSVTVGEAAVPKNLRPLLDYMTELARTGR